MEKNIEAVKESICVDYCKWLEKVNAISKQEPKEIEHLKRVLEKICEGCPLNRI